VHQSHIVVVYGNLLDPEAGWNGSGTLFDGAIHNALLLGGHLTLVPYILHHGAYTFTKDLGLAASLESAGVEFSFAIDLVGKHFCSYSEVERKSDTDYGYTVNSGTVDGRYPDQYSPEEYRMMARVQAENTELVNEFSDKVGNIIRVFQGSQYARQIMVQKDDIDLILAKNSVAVWGRPATAEVTGSLGLMDLVAMIDSSIHEMCMPDLSALEFSQVVELKSKMDVNVEPVISTLLELARELHGEGEGARDEQQIRLLLREKVIPKVSEARRFVEREVMDRKWRIFEKGAKYFGALAANFITPFPLYTMPLVIPFAKDLAEEIVAREQPVKVEDPIAQLVLEYDRVIPVV